MLLYILVLVKGVGVELGDADILAEQRRYILERGGVAKRWDVSAEWVRLVKDELRKR